MYAKITNKFYKRRRHWCGNRSYDSCGCQHNEKRQKCKKKIEQCSKNSVRLYGQHFIYAKINFHHITVIKKARPYKNTGVQTFIYTLLIYQILFKERYFSYNYIKRYSKCKNCTKLTYSHNCKSEEK